MSQKERLTIYDIAAEAGVSRATVSRVLNDKPDVSPATRAKVLKVLSKHRFVRNQSAANLAGAQSDTVGLIIPNLESRWATEILSGIGEAASNAQRQLLLATTASESAYEENWLQFLGSHSVAGVLMILAASSSQRLLQIKESNLPLVLVDYHGYDVPVPHVRAANFDGAYAAVKHLIGLGHRRIATITGDPRYGCAKERLEGYRSALKDSGLPVDPKLISEGNFKEELGMKHTRRWMAMPDPPTAIFCGNDLTAFGAMQALKEMGRRVPEDVSLVGFDDLPGAERTDPGLTTVRQPMREMGKAAFSLLMQQQNQPKEEAPQMVTLSTQLIIRQSTAPPKRAVSVS